MPRSSQWNTITFKLDISQILLLEDFFQNIHVPSSRLSTTEARHIPHRLAQLPNPNHLLLRHGRIQIPLTIVFQVVIAFGTLELRYALVHHTVAGDISEVYAPLPCVLETALALVVGVAAEHDEPRGQVDGLGNIVSGHV